MAIAAVALGAGFGAPLAAAGVETFKDVVVRNGADNPVLTKAVGTDAVEVRNADDDPIPTMGVGTQKVRVEGTPQISIAGTPQVQAAPQQVVQRYVEFTGQCGHFELPVGRVFVVQAVHVSTDSQSPNAYAALQTFVKTRPDKGTGWTMIPVDLQPSGTGAQRRIGSTETLVRVDLADSMENAEIGQAYNLGVCAGDDTQMAHDKRAIVVGYFE